jgi:hypothetical protein
MVKHRNDNQPSPARRGRSWAWKGGAVLGALLLGLSVLWLRAEEGGLKKMSGVIVDANGERIRLAVDNTHTHTFRVPFQQTADGFKFDEKISQLAASFKPGDQVEITYEEGKGQDFIRDVRLLDNPVTQPTRPAETVTDTRPAQTAGSAADASQLARDVAQIKRDVAQMKVVLKAMAAKQGIPWPEEKEEGQEENQ